jgi:hypothetical protein
MGSLIAKEMVWMRRSDGREPTMVPMACFGAPINYKGQLTTHWEGERGRERGREREREGEGERVSPLSSS